MPVIVTLNVMLAKRNMRLSDLSARIGKDVSNVSILNTNSAKGIRFGTLSDICRELECQPADLMEYVDDKEYKKRMGISWKEFMERD